MASVDPRNWAREVADDLFVGGERIPFDRVLQQHLDALPALRAQGLTWNSLARLLAAAGVKRGDGKFYSADHLRFSVQRLKAPETIGLAKPTRDGRKVSTGCDVNSAAVAPIVQPPSLLSRSKPTDRAKASAPQRSRSHSDRNPSTTKDVSDDEIAGALDRLNRIKP